MPHPHLLVQPRAGFTWLRLSNPERRNALDVSLGMALRDALSDDLEQPLLLGSADPAMFCSGADLTLPDAERAAVSDLVYDCCELLITRPGPVIAVITGPAVGGGAQIAAAADIRVAGPGARLKFTGPPELNLVIGAWLLPGVVGRGLAMDLVLTGRWIESGEALAAGLLSRVVPDPADAAEAMVASFGALTAVKEVMAAGDLMDRLRAERRANQDAWAIRIGS
jgi:enoyl-CoA hydratase